MSFTTPGFAPSLNVPGWRCYDGMPEHPAFKATTFEPDDYEQCLVEHYYPYSPGERQTDITRVN